MPRVREKICLDILSSSSVNRLVAPDFRGRGKVDESLGNSFYAPLWGICDLVYAS